MTSPIISWNTNRNFHKIIWSPLNAQKQSLVGTKLALVNNGHTASNRQNLTGKMWQSQSFSTSYFGVSVSKGWFLGGFGMGAWWFLGFIVIQLSWTMWKLEFWIALFILIERWMGSGSLFSLAPTVFPDPLGNLQDCFGVERFSVLELLKCWEMG